MYVLLTAKGLQRIDLEKLKFFTKVQGWFCAAQVHLFNMIMDKEITVSNTICRSLEEFKIDKNFLSQPMFSSQIKNCPNSNCFCGMDIGLPKGKTLEHLDTLIREFSALTAEEQNSLPKYDNSSEIMAMGISDFLLKRSVHVDWFLGKRCNFDCHYCSPTIHDNHSEMPKLDVLISAYNHLKDTIKRSTSPFPRDEIKFLFHGGEPTLIPQYLEFLRHIDSDTQIIKSITTLTNFSRDVNFFVELNKISNLTYSVHLDYVRDTSFEKLEKFLETRTSDKSFLVKIMYQRKFRQEIDRFVDLVSQHSGISLAITPLHMKSNKELYEYNEDDKKYFFSLPT